MHGCCSGSALLVNAEVDSMGGVVDGGVGIGLKASPRRAAIEKAQAELRQEYDVRDERRKELEFLEKGGNPLDFKFGSAASVSVQSTSLTDQNPEHIVTSEAKGSFALAASPHGDSVDSSSRPGIPTVSEPNTADNLLLFDGDHDLPEAERNSVHLSRRNNIARSEQSSQIDGAQNAKESEDSAIVRPYARRNRSRSNREGARSNTIDVTQNRGGQGSTLPIRGGSRDPKLQTGEKNNLKVQNTPSVSILKSASSNGDLTPLAVASNNHLDAELDGACVPEIIAEPTKALDETKLDVVPPKNSNEIQRNQPSQVDSQNPPVLVSRESDVGVKHPVAPVVLECLPCATTGTTEKEATTQLNGSSDIREDNSVLNEVENGNAAVGSKGVDSQSSCNQSSIGLDVHKDSDVCVGTQNVDTNIISQGKTSDVEGTLDAGSVTPARDVNEVETVNDVAGIKEDHSSVLPNQPGIPGSEKTDKDVCEGSSELPNEVKMSLDNEGGQPSDHMVLETNGKGDDVSNNNCNLKENAAQKCQESLDVSMQELPEAPLSDVPSTVAPDLQTTCVNRLKVLDRAHEDSILEEARIIQAKHKRIAELSVRSVPPENRRKCNWDFVLEEMAWLANDFAQERLWKITAAAQVCHRAAHASRSRFDRQQQCWKLKEIAHDMGKAVLQFWHSAEKPVKEQESGGSRKEISLTVLGYAVRFLKYNSSLNIPQTTEAPTTPDRIYDLGIQDMSWEDHLTEESLFYTVPSGAIETYRKSIESHLVQIEKIGSGMQEEVETSMYEDGAEYGFQENVYGEDEGETSTYYLSGGFEGTKPSKSTQKNRKVMVSYPRSYEGGADLPYLPTPMSQQSTLMGKRPASLNVGGAIPTKRMRTASRQRVVTPTANAQVQMKTDASSGDTTSFQEDPSGMHGGSQFQKSMEVESFGDYDKQLAYDCAETSVKPKKKKKAKHLGSAYDQGWQMDSSTLNEQRDHSKKRLESHHFDSNGTSGLYMQSNAKKPKLSKQPLENTFDNMNTMASSIPSPVASQNNISHTTKFIKLIGGRDRGRKSKSLKMSVGQPGSGSPWSLFEDQALVVLVHDMGPNWELISDAINSSLHFKCIFRKPKDCKERHKLVMDKGSGDGADSAEDSGSSQSYPSTLPGIPKGSARQLFQRLQEPLEEDTIKSHFDKIIKIGQKQHYRRTQNENQDLKQIAVMHNSHVMALSQAFPNNLNGDLLTPLDLSDANSSNQDMIPYGCQSSHSSGLPISNQGAAAPLLPSPGANSSLQGSSGGVHGTNLPTSSGALNPSNRDGRYGVPRASSLPVEEQQRMQQYNHVPGRNIQQSSLPPGSIPGTDRGVRMLPGGNGVGITPGMNRNMQMSRPGYQGINSASMLNSGSMLSSSMGMPSAVNSINSGPGSAQGNSMIRPPREALHMMRPGHNSDHQRPMMVPELQMQAAQGSSQGVTPFNGLSSGFPNQTSAAPVATYPGHPQVALQQPHGLGSSPHHPHLPNHVTGSQQPYVHRLAKERQMHQQRYVQQQQFSGPNAVMPPHAQPQNHLPVSSTVQNSSQIQSQTPSQPVSMSPLTPLSPMTPISVQHQQKHHMPHGMGRSSGATTNQMGKQRQRQAQQHIQQSGRQHPQQRQHLPSQQQSKVFKGGVGRGLNQNLPVDPSHLNGLTIPPVSQPVEAMQMMQGQGVYSGSALNAMQPPKPTVPQSSKQLQPKLVSASVPSSTKQHQQIRSHLDNNTQGQVSSASSGQVLSSSHQVVPAAATGSSHQQPQPQPHKKQVNQSQHGVQRATQQNRQVTPDLPGKPQNDTALSEQQTMSSKAGMGLAIPQSSVDSSAAVPMTSATSSQWKSSELAYDSNLPNSTIQTGSVGSPSLTHSSGGVPEPTPPANQGGGPGPTPTRQLSGSLASHGHNVGAQWQQSQQQPPPMPQQPQYTQQEQQQQLPELKSTPNQIPQPQQQIPPLMQAGQGMYLRPSNSKPE